MPTTVLKLTPAELKEMVNPADDPVLFQYGDQPGIMTEAQVLSMEEREESEFLSAMPEHFRQIICGEVTGQILTRFELGARGGETSLQLAFYPLVADTLLLYKNFTTEYDIPWASRRREHALTVTTDYTVNETTGAITLTEALEEGDVVVADYNHTGGALFGSVRSLVLKACRLELYSMFPNWTDSTDIIQEMREVIDNKLLQFTAGPEPKGVSEIDQLHFLKETRASNRNTKTRRFMGGAIG